MLRPPAELAAEDYIAKLQVRIKVVAAALNYADALQIQGQYQTKPKLPFVPGSEFSGRIIEVGQNVRNLGVGDQVRAC